MKQVFTFLIFTFLSGFLFAQNSTVTGTIQDSNSGLPLLGATVLEKGTANGVITDFDGNFTINNVSQGGVLVVSYLGYITKEATITGISLNISLEEDASSLEEVIVVGYGTQKRKEITGAVSVISAETIEDLKPVRIEQALQGQVAGVQVTSGSGAPGAASNIRIRGVSTNGDSRPLIILDGNIIEDLSVVNPSDIESINVLKDATAGIYGVRAANGVILITTKGGSYSSEVVFDVKSYYGIQETTRKIPVLNATEYALLVNEARTNGGQAPLFTNVGALGEGTDWQNEVFEKAPIYNFDVNVSGGTENSRTSFSAALLDQDGIVGGDKSNFNRFTSKLSHDRKLIKNLKMNSSILFSGIERKGLSENAIGSVLYNALNNAPTFAVRDENGSFTKAEGLGVEVINPVAQIANANNKTRVRKLSGAFGLKYSFLDNFEVESRIQANYAEVLEYTFTPILDYGSGKVFNNTIPTVTDRFRIFRDYTFDAFATYNNSFNDIHTISATLGTSIFQETGRDVLFVGRNSNNIEDANNVEDVFRDRGIDSSFDQRLLSYFVRFQYNFKEKYLFSGVFRRDGSTKFGPKNKFGYFPSASAGWVISEENFLEDSKTIDFLKLRASYGVLGNDRIGNFRFESSLDGEGEYVFDDALAGGVAIGPLSNPEIKWEEQTTFDVGVDARFLDNRLDVTFDYFNKKTEDLLIQAPVSGILGGTAPGSQPPFINAGTVENKGFEVSLGYRKTVNDNFKFNFNINAATIQNEVLKVNNENTPVFGGDFNVGQDPISFFEVGQPIGYFKGLKTEGVFQNQAEIDAHATQDGALPGDIRFVDVNGDGVINSDDRTNVGDPIADATFGLNIGFSYKNFDFLTYAFASVGNDIVRNYERFQPLTNRSTAFLDRWAGEGTSNEVPRVTTSATGNSQFSDYFVEDGSFIRVQNIQLGYTVSQDFLKDFQIDDVRIYASVSNAFTLTKYRGYDPTASNGAPVGGGIDQAFYPSPRTYLFGVNFKF